MCGIAGIINSQNISDTRINKMLELMEHRGPDDWGITYIGKNIEQLKTNAKIDFIPYENASVILAHKRLSIIDLSEHGRQPMHSNDNSIAITFNGEIYNYIELKEELISDYIFKTESDTEVLIAAYMKWGISMLDKLNGMFSMVIWDKNKNTILCARDPIGIKPFYYAINGNEFVFASEPKPVISALNKKASIDYTSLSEFLVLGVSDHDSRTFYNEIKQLKGGYYLELNLSGQIVKEEAFWKPEQVTIKNNLSETDVVENMHSALSQSVKLHLRSDVPVGSALSGGIDSSTIVYFVSTILKEKSPAYKCLTISNPGFEDDESELAKAICKATNTTWIPVQADTNNMLDEFERFLKHIGEPFSNMTMFAQYQVMQLAAKNGLKVMIDGQGGDELFSGYDRVAQRILIDKLLSLNIVGFIKEWFALRKNANLSLMQTLLSNLYFNIPSFAIRRRKSRITKYVSAKSLNSYRSHIAKEVFSFSGIKKTQKLELQKYALPRLLKYEDRNSMAFSIESRVPFVSKDLIECGLSLPSNYLVNNGWTKYAVRKTMNKKLPDKIIWNTIKRGFDIPEHEWMQHLKPGLIKWIGEMKDNDVINKNTLLSSLENACTINEIRVLWPIISVALWMKFEDIYE